jgi:flagellar biosynthesis protein
MADELPRAKQQSAVALAYQGGDPAPKVVAKGKGLLAEQIIGRAREAGVFVHESKELVALLMEVDLDRQIPPALYRAIAELLAWLYHIESAQQAGRELPAPPNTALLIDPT